MIKQKIMVLCTAVVVSSVVLADDLSVQPVSNTFDKSKVFELDSNKPLNVTELSKAEMKKTEGAWVSRVVVPMIDGIAGGVGSLAAYETWCATHPTCDSSDVKAEAGAFWGGFVAGAIGSPMLGSAIGGYIGYEIAN